MAKQQKNKQEKRQFEDSSEVLADHSLPGLKNLKSGSVS